MTNNQSMGNIRALNEPTTLSYGGKAVGLPFNPSGDELVFKLKAHYAEIIDICNDLRSQTDDAETKRLYSVAITEAQAAQMWAVKAVTWNK